MAVAEWWCSGGGRGEAVEVVRRDGGARYERQGEKQPASTLAAPSRHHSKHSQASARLDLPPAFKICNLFQYPYTAQIWIWVWSSFKEQQTYRGTYVSFKKRNEAIICF